jgi:hypothetical protein
MQIDHRTNTYTFDGVRWYSCEERRALIDPALLEDLMEDYDVARITSTTPQRTLADTERSSDSVCVTLDPTLKQMIGLTAEMTRVNKSLMRAVAAVRMFRLRLDDEKPIYVCWYCELASHEVLCPKCGRPAVDLAYLPSGGGPMQRAFAAEWLTEMLAREPDCALWVSRIRVRAWSSSPVCWAEIEKIAISLGFIPAQNRVDNRQEVWRLPDDHPRRP